MLTPSSTTASTLAVTTNRTADFINSLRTLPNETTTRTVLDDVIAYIRVIIIFIGLLGNSTSFCVFMSKNMRGLCASCYLAAVSIADNATILFFLLPDVLWIKDNWDWLNDEGVCHVRLYLSALARFMSVWLIVCFTVERYICVSKPLESRSIASVAGTLKRIALLSFTASLVMLFRPLIRIGADVPCIVPTEKMLMDFMMELTFMFSITVIPFVIITLLNILIIRQLCIAKRRHQDLLMTEESHIRFEFTVILLAVSFFFILFNIPYLYAWAHKYIHFYVTHVVQENPSAEDMHKNRELTTLVDITKTIFGLNYCINFFLYSISGVYFRRQLRALIEINRIRRSFMSRISSSTRYSNVTNKNTPV